MAICDRMTTALGAAVSLALCGTAYAKDGQSVPWQIGFQPPASPIMAQIESFHTYVNIIIVLIALFVLALLIYVMARFNERRHPQPSRTTHNTALEIAWTVIPVLILVAIAIPSFRLLYGLLIVGLGRRQILWLGVTAHPTAEWIANQLTEACGWEQVPRDLIRDRDGCYGRVFIRRVRALGIRDHPTSSRSPWQNGYAERLIGSIRRECLDHIVVFGERHLRHVLLSYMDYHNAARTHLSLCKDAPVHRRIQRFGTIEAQPVLGGLHHHYVRKALR